jgi:hypothetical protein
MAPCNVGVMRIFSDVTGWLHRHDVILLREAVSCTVSWRKWRISEKHGVVGDD